MCYLVPFIELAVSHTSVLTILAITVERYVAICLPLRAGEICTKKNACITCVIVWLFAFGVTAPILAMTTYAIPGGLESEEAVCYTAVEGPWQKFYYIFIITVFFFIPLLVLILLYINITRHLVIPPSTDDEQVNPS